MSGGIDQLVDTYKGNPQPLQAKVQKDQQSQPPGQLTPDLEEAIALQKIAELQQGAQNQQAMQAGGAQQSVVEKLRQMLAGNQAQAQMAQGAPAQQGQPVMAARGGSIDQLMSNLGRHYAGGGIVAFSGKDSSQFVQDLSELPQAFDDMKQRAREEDARQAAADRRMEQYKKEKLAAQQKTSFFNYLFGSPEQEKEGQAKLAELSNAPLPKSAEPAYTDPEVEKLKRLAAARPLTGVSTNTDLIPKKTITGASPADAAPKTSGTPGGPAAPAAPAALDPESLRGLTEAYIKGEFKLSPEQERDKAIEFAKKTMGLDALLGEKERRANEREASIKNIEAKRTPAWVEGLANARKLPSNRGGIGSLIGQMGDTADATRQNYELQSLGFQKELAQLRDVITDAKISGNKELLKEGMAAYKEVDARRRSAANNATSLVATDERTETSKQIAKDAAAARIAAAAGRGAGAGDKQQLNELKALQTNLKDQMKNVFNSAERQKIQTQLNQVNAAIAKMAGLDTMAAAPGAGSPGGTSLKYNPKTGKIE
jgi:hypothetical protein